MADTNDARPTDDAGGTMHYGGTDAAYEGMEDRGEGDAGDRAVATDRDDLRGPAGHTADAGAPSTLGDSGYNDEQETQNDATVKPKTPSVDDVRDADQEGPSTGKLDPPSDEPNSAA